MKIKKSKLINLINESIIKTIKEEDNSLSNSEMLYRLINDGRISPQDLLAKLIEFIPDDELGRFRAHYFNYFNNI